MEIQIDLDKFPRIKGNEFIKKYKKYKKIIITWNKITLDFTISESKDLYSGKISYRLSTSQKSNSNLDIISILFHDPIQEISSFSNIYIENISKKDGLISGSNAVLFAIAVIQKIIETKYIYLYDGASVQYKNSENELDLSLYKLIVDHKTFYGKFGFELYYKNKSLQKKMLYYASKIQNYTLNKIIVELKSIVFFIEKYFYNKISATMVNYYNKTIETKDIISYKEKKDIYNNYQIIISILSKLNKKIKIRFDEGIKILNKKYFFELCMLFDKIINKFNFDYIIFKVKSDSLINGVEETLDHTVSSKFIFLFIKLYILVNNYQHKGLYRRKVFIYNNS
jgi:hypothetical protein